MRQEMGGGGCCRRAPHIGLPLSPPHNHLDYNGNIIHVLVSLRLAAWSAFNVFGSIERKACVHVSAA